VVNEGESFRREARPIFNLLKSQRVEKLKGATVKQTFEDYCQELSGKAEELAQEVEMRERLEHLSAFSFGRAVQRLGDAQHDYWVRVRWLLVGAAIGATFAAGFIQAWQLSH
jgi:hypothetical protein